MIGRDIGSTIRPEQLERTGAVDPGGLEDLARQVVEEALDQRSTLNALAPAGSQTAQNVSISRTVDERHVDDGQVERHEQHDRRHEQRGQHQPVSTRRNRGRRTDSA